MKNEFCTYLTIYKENKLPPFYLGSGTLYNIQNKNYFGSVSSITYKSIWKEELKNNPHLFDIKIIKTFSTREEAYVKEERLQRTLNVVKNPLYINKGIACEGHNRGDRSRPIVQLDLLGNFIREYKSLTACSRILLNRTDPGNIGACVKGVTTTAYGFQWVYKDDYDNLKEYTMPGNIFQYGIDSNLVKIWGDIGSVKKEFGIIKLSNCNYTGKISVSGGFLWFRREFLMGEDVISKYIVDKGIIMFEGQLRTSIYISKEFILYNGKNNNVNSLFIRDLEEPLKSRYISRHSSRKIFNNNLLFTKDQWDTDHTSCIKEYEDIVRLNQERLIILKEKTKARYNERFVKIPIIQLDLLGNVINRYDSLLDIKNNMGVKYYNNVKECLKKINITSGDFQWFFEEDYNNNPDIGKNVDFSGNYSYVIAQIDKVSGVIIKLWKSAISVRQYFGSGDVNAVLRKKQSTANGFKWNELSKEKLGSVDCVGLNISEVEYAILR